MMDILGIILYMIEIPSIVVLKLLGNQAVMVYGGLISYFLLFLLLGFMFIYFSIGKILMPYLRARLTGGIVVEFELPNKTNIFKVISKNAEYIQYKLKYGEGKWRINPNSIRILPHGIRKTIATALSNTTFSAENLAEIQAINELINVLRELVMGETKLTSDMYNVMDNIKTNLRASMDDFNKFGEFIKTSIYYIVKRLDDILPPEMTAIMIESQANLLELKKADVNRQIIKYGFFITFIFVIGLMGLLLYQQISKPVIVKHVGDVIMTTTTTLKQVNLK